MIGWIVTGSAVVLVGVAAVQQKLADFEQAPFKDEVRPLILKENAMRLLGVSAE